MRPDQFKRSLRQSAKDYADSNALRIDESWSSAVIFENVADNFHPDSYQAIGETPDWLGRTLKPHNRVADALEMQSSNSSDALLMSVFCHPRLVTWKGVTDLLGFVPTDPVFGLKARVAKQGTDGDATEIDLAIGDCLVEAKLTEKDFTEKAAPEVLRYTHLQEHFHVDLLGQRNGHFQNYQVIRNLLAAIQHWRKHVLICDERRPDLVVRYMDTVSCLRDPAHRVNCRVVFWQDLARASGRDLSEFLASKYGIR
jgi:hypothetical protein